MKKMNDNILLTRKESCEIAESLETLEAMGGVCDGDFNMECDRAGVLARRMRKII